MGVDGGEGEVANAGLRGQAIDERREIATKQRLAARQPDLVHAARQKLIDQAIDLFKPQNVFADTAGCSDR